MKSSSVFIRGFQPGKRKICGTVIVLALIIGSVLLAHTAFGDKANENSLNKVFFVFRHGDRNPTETYNNDPYKNYLWPNGWGALTKKGMRQMFGLGQLIRKEFGWITKNTYNSVNTIVNSSYSDRCIMSAQALLAGLYLEKDSFVKDLHWRPIPVHYLPKIMDTMLVVGKPCPRLTSELNNAYLNESRRSDATYKLYYNRLSEITGQTISTVTDVEFLYNTLEIEEMNGLVLPPMIKEYFTLEMREIASRSYTLFTSNKMQQRLRGGPLLKHILETMKYGNANEKMFLYCTHDVHIVNVLRTMGFTNELFKLDFGVTLIFELLQTHKSQSQQVRISMLNNTETTVPYLLKIPGCEYPCLLDKLFDIWQDVLPVNWDLECQQQSS
ncbi:PREDICTED: lysosomal acid phosphatase-like [Ceratosolen solmsi marchali]|uniref:Lysosomal acid phosphatase-like n=1 Tax=Ceratosolen solmsi marchali TaxID=326594 RepID=A0AAJ6YIF7_9HYME|nr:PREDICTED: lysosomal acid phosphatase-like [Ceratosolen solmsi marchali]